LSEAAARRVLPGGDHSIAWLTWHSARIEDVTMGVLLAGGPQLMERDGWFEKLKVNARDTDNLISAAALADLKLKVDPARLRWLLDEGALVSAAQDAINYWAGLKISGLLLMPPPRHNFIYLNQALRLKQKIK
jgi:hypothetical protein